MRYLYFTVLVFIFSACSDDEGTTTVQPKIWVLAEIESVNGDIIAGDDIIFNEKITLKNDQTFDKEKVREGEVIFESSGTYEFDYQTDVTYLHLDHIADDQNIINCDGSTRETFIFSGDVLTNNSSACDWPIYRFLEEK